MTKEEREERDLEQMQTPRRKNVDDSNNKQDDEDDDDDDGYSFIFCIILYSGILCLYINISNVILDNFTYKPFICTSRPVIFHKL